MKEHDPVVLAEGIPEQGLKKGDIGTVVLVHGDGAGHEIEFVTLAGATSR